jgi:hypothetical protein
MDALKHNNLLYILDIYWEVGYHNWLHDNRLALSSKSPKQHFTGTQYFLVIISKYDHNKLAKNVMMEVTNQQRNIVD